MHPLRGKCTLQFAVSIIVSIRFLVTTIKYTEFFCILLPQGLETIGGNVFEDFKGLSAISIPASVKTICYKAFYHSSITTVEFKEGLEKIGVGAFAVTPLENVRIPRSVKTIGGQAFYGCSRLRDFYISSEVDNLGKELFGKFDADKSTIMGNPSGIYVHTPAGSAAEKYMEHYSGVQVVNDYSKE